MNRLLAETTDIVGRLTNKVNMMSESETMLQFEIDELKAENNKLSDEIVKQKKERQSAEEHQENTITLCRNEVCIFEKFKLALCSLRLNQPPLASSIFQVKMNISRCLALLLFTKTNGASVAMKFDPVG